MSEPKRVEYIFNSQEQTLQLISYYFVVSQYMWAGNTKRGSITVPLTSCLTGLESAVCLLRIFVVICKTDQSKPVKQEVNCTVILPPLVLPDVGKDRKLVKHLSNTSLRSCLLKSPKGKTLQLIRKKKVLQDFIGNGRF